MLQCFTSVWMSVHCFCPCVTEHSHLFNDLSSWLNWLNLKTLTGMGRKWAWEICSFNSPYSSHFSSANHSFLTYVSYLASGSTSPSHRKLKFLCLSCSELLSYSCQIATQQIFEWRLELYSRVFTMWVNNVMINLGVRLLLAASSRKKKPLVLVSMWMFFDMWSPPKHWVAVKLHQIWVWGVLRPGGCFRLFVCSWSCLGGRAVSVSGSRVSQQNVAL